MCVCEYITLECVTVYLYIYVCLPMCMGVCTCVEGEMWKSETTMETFIVSVHYVASWDQTQAPGLAAKCL